MQVQSAGVLTAAGVVMTKLPKNLYDFLVIVCNLEKKFAEKRVFIMPTIQHCCQAAETSDDDDDNGCDETNTVGEGPTSGATSSSSEAHPIVGVVCVQPPAKYRRLRSKTSCD